MTKLEQTRISIDRVKIAAFMSEETLAFTARVLLDGRPIAQARNAGHGGSTDILPIHGGGNPAALETAQAYCATLPPMRFKFDGGAEHSAAWNLDDVVDHLAADYEFDKKVRAGFNRMMRNYVAYEHGGAIYQYKRARVADVAALEKKILQNKPGAVILHTVPTDTAYAIYKRVCVKD